MGADITLDSLRKRKCIICGDIHKSISNVMNGQMHIATVTVCCNCGFTSTYSHSASEYAKYLETGGVDYHTEVCFENQSNCMVKEGCPKIQKGRKI